MEDEIKQPCASHWWNQPPTVYQGTVIYWKTGSFCHKKITEYKFNNLTRKWWNQFEIDYTNILVILCSQNDETETWYHNCKASWTAKIIGSFNQGTWRGYTGSYTSTCIYNISILLNLQYFIMNGLENSDSWLILLLLLCNTGKSMWRWDFTK